MTRARAATVATTVARITMIADFGIICSPRKESTNRGDSYEPPARYDLPDVIRLLGCVLGSSPEERGVLAGTLRTGGI
jgi:hypothetical protein